MLSTVRLRTNQRVSKFAFVAFLFFFGVTTASAISPVANLMCDVNGMDAVVSWTNTDSYVSISVERNGMPIAVLPGTATSYVDMFAPLPAVYTIIPTCPGVMAQPESCTAGSSSMGTDEWFTGYHHVAIGDASVTRELGRLKVSNLGSSGCDGVSIALDDSDHCRIELLALAPTVLPEGGTVIFDGVSEGPVGDVSTGEVRLHVSGGEFQISADYASTGAQTFTMTVIGEGGEVLYTQAGIPNGEVVATTPGAWNWFYKEYDEDGNVTESCLLKIDSSPVHPTFSAPIDDAVGIRFRADQPATLAPGLDRLRLRGADVPELRIARTTAYFEGWPCYGTGEAHLENQESSSGKLKVSNLGSSGCDGYSIASPTDDDFLSVELDVALDPSDPSNDDGWIMLESLSQGVRRGSMSATEVNGEWQFTADYTDGGSPTYTLEVHNQGQLVHSESGLSGPAATSPMKVRIFYKEYENGELVEKCFISFEAAPVTTGGGVTVMGDTIMTRPDVAVTAPGRETQMRAANIEELLITTISGTPGAEDSMFRRGDCNADGLKDIGDAVFLLDVLFASGGPMTCADSCDANDDGGNDLGDAITLLNHLFAGGSIPTPEDCGADATDDSLGCDGYPCP